MCFSPDLDALSRLRWAFATPFYLLSLLFMAYLLSHVKKLAVVFIKRNCLRMFWIVILLSYGSISTTSFRLLKCVELTSKSTLYSGRLLAEDASVKCFEGEHLPAGVAAILIILCMCIPPLLILPFLHRSIRFKPFADVYTSLYRDNRRWWSGFDLFRRLLLAVVFTAEVNSASQHLASLLCCILLLTVHTLAWPFKETRSNIIEAVFLSSLACIAVLAGPDITWSRAFAIQWLFFVPIGGVLIDGIVRFAPEFKKEYRGIFKFQMETEEEMFSKSLQEAKVQGRLELRDPLLADQDT